jgi:hypothetical protein
LQQIVNHLPSHVILQPPVSIYAHSASEVNHLLTQHTCKLSAVIDI